VIDAFVAPQLRENPLLFLVQLGRDDAGDRLADHLARFVAEQALGGGVPRGDHAVDGLADDRVVGRGDDGREARSLHLAHVPIGDVHEQVDAGDHAAGGVPQGGRIGQEAHPGAVRPFRDGLDPAHRPPFLERHRHRALVVRQGSAVRPEQPPRPAPLAAADLRTAAPQVGGGLVVVGDASLGVGHVDRYRQCVEQLGADHHATRPKAVTPLICPNAAASPWFPRTGAPGGASYQAALAGVVGWGLAGGAIKPRRSPRSPPGNSGWRGPAGRTGCCRAGARRNRSAGCRAPWARRAGCRCRW
jgi:hypothetical protein